MSIWDLENKQVLIIFHLKWCFISKPPSIGLIIWKLLKKCQNCKRFIQFVSQGFLKLYFQFISDMRIMVFSSFPLVTNQPSNCSFAQLSACVGWKGNSAPGKGGIDEQGCVLWACRELPGMGFKKSLQPSLKIPAFCQMLFVEKGKTKRKLK